jgi:hypothetical protein
VCVWFSLDSLRPRSGCGVVMATTVERPLASRPITSLQNEASACTSAWELTVVTGTTRTPACVSQKREEKSGA